MHLTDAVVRRLLGGPGTRRARASRRHPLGAAGALVVVLVGAGTAAATDRLPIFRSAAVAPVPIRPSDLVGLPDLGTLGDVVVSGDGNVHAVANADAAAAATGLAVPEVASLPRGVGGEPTYSVGGPVSASLTFSADRVAAAVDDAGPAVPAVPPVLDGATVRLVAGRGWIATWAGATGAPALVVGRAVAPEVSSADVELDVVRDHLLSLPGTPDDVATQLRALPADGSTLPLVLPGDRVTTSAASVHGVPATVLATRDGLLSAVVWVDDGVVTAVGGTLAVDEVVAVAEGLR